MSDEILDLFAEDEVPDEIREEQNSEKSYEQMDAEFKKAFLAFLEEKKKYIEKWNSIRRGNTRAATPAQLATQELIEEYHDIISDLEESKGKIISAFSLGALTEKEISNHDYPTAIRVWHIVKSAGFYAIITGGLSFVGLNLLGSSNPEFWTGSLIGKVAGFGSVFGVGTGVAAFIASKKGFNRRTVDKKKLNFVEKLLMRRVRQREKALLNITTEFYDQMPSILSGNFEMYRTETTFRKEHIFFGKSVPVTKRVLKEEYKGLPLIKRIKISRLLKKFKNLNDKTIELEERLEKQRARKAIIEEERRRIEEEARKKAEEDARIAHQAPTPTETRTVEATTTPAPEEKKRVVAHRRHKSELAPGTKVISNKTNPTGKRH